MSEKIMYTVYWFRYPHGIEGEEMICKQREFDSLEKATGYIMRLMRVN